MDGLLLALYFSRCPAEQAALCCWPAYSPAPVLPLLAGGTTDITRTMHFGSPSAHQKACFTAVLQVGCALAALAAALWARQPSVLCLPELPECHGCFKDALPELDALAAAGPHQPGWTRHLCTTVTLYCPLNLGFTFFGPFITCRATSGWTPRCGRRAPPAARLTRWHAPRCGRWDSTTGKLWYRLVFPAGSGSCAASTGR